MAKSPEPGSRIFKTRWFSKSAKKARISDAELREAMMQVMNGQCVDLGGGVFKKRLDKNRHRSIILAKGGQLWVYEYLFAKKDRANITEAQLVGFRKLAKGYEGLAEHQLSVLIEDGDFVEICHGDKT